MAGDDDVAVEDVVERTDLQALEANVKSWLTEGAKRTDKTIGTITSTLVAITDRLVALEKRLPTPTEEGDEDINYNTSTSTPAAPFPAPPDAPSPQAPPSSSSGPITRVRARDLNFVMLLKNEGPEE